MSSFLSLQAIARLLHTLTSTLQNLIISLDNHRIEEPWTNSVRRESSRRGRTRVSRSSSWRTLRSTRHRLQNEYRPACFSIMVRDRILRHCIDVLRSGFTSDSEPHELRTVGNHPSIIQRDDMLRSIHHRSHEESLSSAILPMYEKKLFKSCVDRSLIALTSTGRLQRKETRTGSCSLAHRPARRCV